jgi:phosphocarrier protein HPr
MKKAAKSRRARTESGASDRKEDPRVTRHYVIDYAYGFHARPAALFAKTALQFDAEILVGRNGGSGVNGKSIMGLLTLEISRGEILTVHATGSDAHEAMAAIEGLFIGALAHREEPPVHVSILATGVALV